MLDIDPFLGDQIRVGGLGGLGGMPPPEPPKSPEFSVIPYADRLGVNYGTLEKPEGIVVHHTAGRGDVDGVLNVFRQRGLASQYVMDRDGKVYQVLPDGSIGRHMRPSERNNLSNRNSIGIEVIANDDNDWTDAQKAAINPWLTYATGKYGVPTANVYGHGELNSHKQATEGMTAVRPWREMNRVSPSFGAPAQQEAVPMAQRSFMRPGGERPQAAARGAEFEEAIQAASAETGVPADILRAKIRQESQFNPNAIGKSGEVGLAQIKPSTARDPGFGLQGIDPEDLRDPAKNIMFGARYLAARAKAAGVTDWNTPENAAKALTAYNGGGDPNYASNVLRYRSAPAAAYAANEPAPRPDAMPASFGRALGGVAVRSPMAERIGQFATTATERSISGPYPKEEPVQVASVGNTPLSSGAARPGASRPVSLSGQTNMPMEDYARGPDNGVMAFLQMQAAGAGDNSNTIGGLGGLGGFRTPQPTAQAAPGPSGVPQGQQQPMQAQAPESTPLDAFLERAFPVQKPFALEIGGRARAANQQAEAQSIQQRNLAKSLIGQGVPVQQAIVAASSPQNYQAFLTEKRHQEDLAQRKAEFEYRQKNDQQTGTLRDLAAENASRRAKGQPELSPLEYETAVKKAGATVLDVGQRAETAESKGRGEGLAKRMNDIADDGNKAGEDAVFFQRFGDVLSTVKTGKQTETLEKIRQLTGLTLDPNTDNVQALNAMIQYAAPRLRVPGSGAQSDRELSNFLASIPSLAGTPEGNRQVLDTLRGIIDYRKQRAAIAQEWQLGEISAKEANARISKLPPPFAPLKESTPAAPLSSGNAPAVDASQAPSPAVPDASNLPKVFTREDYNKLKPGDYYIDATGKNIRRKGGQ